MESPCRKCGEHENSFPNCFTNGCEKIDEFQVASLRRRHGELINFMVDEYTEFSSVSMEVL